MRRTGNRARRGRSHDQIAMPLEEKIKRPSRCLEQRRRSCSRNRQPAWWTLWRQEEKWTKSKSQERVNRNLPLRQQIREKLRPERRLYTTEAKEPPRETLTSLNELQSLSPEDL